MDARAPPARHHFLPQFLVEARFRFTPGAGFMRASVRRLVAWTIAVAAAFFANCPADIGASAWAQALSDNLWTRPALSGDWGGLRSTLERNGVTFTLNYTNDFLANVHGGIGRGAIGLGAFQPALDLDVAKLAGWDGGHFHTHALITLSLIHI